MKGAMDKLFSYILIGGIIAGSANNNEIRDCNRRLEEERILLITVAWLPLLTVAVMEKFNDSPEIKTDSCGRRPGGKLGDIYEN